MLRNSQFSKGGKGSDERDKMFARLFGLIAVSDSGALFAASSRLEDWEVAVDSLLALAETKAWLAEAAGWALVRATEDLLKSDAEWKEDGLEYLVSSVYEDAKSWTPEKVALTLVLQAARPSLDWKALTAPTFKYQPLLNNHNLAVLGRILKEGGAGDDDDEPNRTGTYKPQLHFVWDKIIAAYFNDQVEGGSFQDFYRTVVDESLFSNTSSAERKYHGFQVFERALPQLPAAQVPLVFTPNFMRTWMNHLSSADRNLHKAALQAARVVNDVVKANPAAGFTLLSQLVGKHGRPDFDRVTKTKTVEGIMASLTADGVLDYVKYLEGLVLGKDEGSSGDLSSADERRGWALDQLAALVRNNTIPKADEWLARVLDLLLVHGFFILRKADKKSPIEAVSCACCSYN